MPVHALLFLTGQCPHCSSVLAALAELLKQGRLARLEAVNLDISPEAGKPYGVRSVPWLRLGPFTLTGNRSPAELAIWAARAASPDDMSDAFHDLLKTGGLDQVLELVSAQPDRLAGLLPIVGNPEASINVRIGAGVVFEAHAAKPALRELMPALGRLSNHADARVRADACHYLGMTGTRARPWLEARLNDPDRDVREIAQDEIAAFEPGNTE